MNTAIFLKRNMYEILYVIIKKYFYLSSRTSQLIVQ